MVPAGIGVAITGAEDLAGADLSDGMAGADLLVLRSFTGPVALGQACTGPVALDPA